MQSRNTRIILLAALALSACSPVDSDDGEWRLVVERDQLTGATTTSASVRVPAGSGYLAVQIGCPAPPSDWDETFGRFGVWDMRTLRVDARDVDLAQQAVRTREGVTVYSPLRVAWGDGAVWGGTLWADPLIPSRFSERFDRRYEIGKERTDAGTAVYPIWGAGLAIEFTLHDGSPIVVRGSQALQSFVDRHCTWQDLGQRGD